MRIGGGRCASGAGKAAFAEPQPTLEGGGFTWRSWFGALVAAVGIASPPGATSLCSPAPRSLSQILDAEAGVPAQLA